MARARSQQPSRIVLGTALLLTCLHAPAARGTDLGAPVMTGDRSLSFLHTHTGKSISVVYYRDGSYVEEALARLNAFLADFRSGDAAQMDPRLFDILHELKMRSGTREPFQVISAFRSPATNEMLRKKTKGVARNSQHTLGKAIDVRLGDVDTKRLRQLALELRAGGVGYYPDSNFVHVDTGRVRRW